MGKISHWMQSVHGKKQQIVLSSQGISMLLYRCISVIMFTTPLSVQQPKKRAPLMVRPVTHSLYASNFTLHKTFKTENVTFYLL